jgi:N-acetylglucosaminyldiphosphoundecaprenol N-acetyl-beta-D-mannosaminyltransferase
MTNIPTIRLLNYTIFSGEKEFFSREFKGVVSTISPHSYIISRKDDLFSEALTASDFIIPDGVGIVMAAKFLNGTRIKKIAGSDLHEEIIKSLNEQGGSCFYLGSSETTLTLIRDRLALEQPAIRVGTYSPPFKAQFTDEENISMIKMVNEFNPDVLFVGMTAPKQEKWVYENRNRINAPVICSIGAVFDFYAGTVKRPGKFWIGLSLEWLPRLLREPGRLWKRNFISTPLFLVYIFYEKLKLLFVPLRQKKR